MLTDKFAFRVTVALFAVVLYMIGGALMVVFALLLEDAGMEWQAMCILFTLVPLFMFCKLTFDWTDKATL